MGRGKTKIILFHSPQGGSGKTTLSIHASLNGAAGSRVLLVDLSTYGNILSVMKIPQRLGNGLSAITTLMELEQNAANKDKLREAISVSLNKGAFHPNLDLLINCNPIRVESINEKFIAILFESLRSFNYDFIFVDTSSTLSSRNVAMFELADYIVAPCIQDISCGWKMMLIKDIFDKCSISKDKVGLVINQCSKSSGFNNAEFENEVGYKILGEIPYFHKNYQSIINKGFIPTRKNKKANACFNSITNKIMTTARTTGEAK